MGQAGGGGRYHFDYFTTERLNFYVQQAINSAMHNFEAKAAPAGLMDVVLGNGWPGILLHEAVGHGLEADFNRKGTSLFSKKLGQQVAAKGVTIVDDGTIEYQRGSLNMDDEGNSTQKNILIEDGILVNYLQDEMNARLMNRPVTGNGRRESYASITMPRMTNTYMLNAPDNQAYDLQEMIESIEFGIYAQEFGGGQVDITSGQFVFSASQAFLIEKGKVTAPLKGATLIGSGADSLMKIKMVGRDLKHDDGVGTCGKDGQSVPVGVGQPSLKIAGMTVGGAEI
jgi:TldD protein